MSLGDLSEHLSRARGNGHHNGHGPAGSAGPAPEPGAAGHGPTANGAGPSAPGTGAAPHIVRHSLAEPAAAVWTWLSRPPVRLALAGALLLVCGAVLLSGSMWTLPLVIVGGLMVVRAWMGSRLKGHLVLEWGESGAQVEFRAHLHAARHPAHDRAASAAAAVTRALEERSARAEQAALDVREAIEGEAHTVEIDLGELKALIAAAEAEGTTGSPEPPVNGARSPVHGARSPVHGAPGSGHAAP